MSTRIEAVGQYIFLAIVAELFLIALAVVLKDRRRLVTWLAVILLIAGAIGFSGYVLGHFGVTLSDELENPLAEDAGVIWSVRIFDNKDLVGPPVFDGKVRGAENGLHLDWGVGSPRRTTPKDRFSAEFTARHDFPADLYCFVIEVDDGGRLTVDGVPVRDAWWGHTPGAVYRNMVRLDAGSHEIVFQFYEENEWAAFHVSWYRRPGPECVTTGHPGVA